MAARLGKLPNAAARISEYRTSQHSCAFYLAWFSRCFHADEGGWRAFTTPDGRAMMKQDAFFWQALEALARFFNEQIAIERAKMTGKGK